MKTYTHPNIEMPSGTVSVIFKDPTKTGSATLEKCIIEIGDVEEGFEYELGSLEVPSCSIKFTHKSNNLLNDMLDTFALEVEITVDGELYFIGDIDFETIQPDLYEDSSNLVGEFEIDCLHRLARLRNYRLGNSASALDPGSFLSDIRIESDPLSTQFMLGNFFKRMAQFLGLASSTRNDVNYILHRTYNWTNTADPGSTVYKKGLFDIVLFRYYLFSKFYGNYYSNRFDTCFELLGELAKEFFFYPRIVKDGSDYRLEIIERDYERSITVAGVKETTPTRKYLFNSFTTRLSNIPDNFDLTDLIFTSNSSSLITGESYFNDMVHTNVIEDDGEWFTNMRFRIFLSGTNSQIPLSVTNNRPTADTTYDSLHEAMHNAYKNIYLGKYKWREVKKRGLKATYSGNTNMRHLSPVYRFSLWSQPHYIHTVRKSVMKNESTLTCLLVDSLGSEFGGPDEPYDPEV